MRHKLTLVFLFFFIQLNLVAQEKNNTPSSILNLEKVYIHTDRTYYNLGETIWYKAYLTNAYNNVLTNNSNLLYVELISPESEIVSRNITKLDFGLGNGDFILNDSIGIHSGKYQLRAYTNWMRNFGEDFIFTKEINVININEANDKVTTIENKKDSDNKYNKNTIEKINNLNIQFFPEGGSLVQGISSVVAFKATDNYGNPVNVEGSILDSKGETISEVKTKHDGLGKFVITSKENENYIGVFQNFNGEKIEFNIPKPLKNGYALSFNKLKERDVITIKTNQETLDKSSNQVFIIRIATKGITYFEGDIVLKKLSTSIFLPIEKLPAGIANITIYDNKGLPHCERLIYVEKNNQVKIAFEPEKVEYNTKEKVRLKLKAKSADDKPIVANFSVAAIDAKTAENPNAKMSISSYFLFESDIKGKVHNAAYYFNPNNLDRLYNLDLLLLTQGWRDFLWKQNIELKDSIHYNSEKGINITGKVKKLFATTGKEDNKVVLYFSNKGNITFAVDTTDVDGKFNFNNVSFVGPTQVLLNTKNKNNKSNGMIVLDSIYRLPKKVNFNAATNFSSSKETIVNLIKENIQQKHVEFDVPMSNRLNEILILGKSKKDIGGNYGFADHTYIASKENAKYSDIYSLIQFSIPGVNIANDSISFRRNGGTALIIVDDVEVQSGDLNLIIPEKVERIEALTSANAAVFGPKGANGVLLIYTKNGEGVSNEKKTFHTITENIEGFYDARIFYSPNYAKPETLESNFSDIRNTLYWNPNVFLDKSGNAEVSYYNSDVNSAVEVTAEGITLEGIPFVAKTNYLVKKN